MVGPWLRKEHLSEQIMQGTAKNDKVYICAIVNQHETAMGALSPDGIGRLTADLRPKANVPLFVSKPRSPCFAILDRPCIVILTVFTLQHDSFNRTALLCDFMFSAVLKTFPSPVYRIFSSSKEEKIQQFLN